ncbi:MAG: hypothetical protein SGILL_009968, partial [Bacillariaceae sp.]
DAIVMWVSLEPVPSIIFDHRSLGKAGESRAEIAFEAIAARGLDVEQLIRFAHYFRGEAQPDQYRPEKNALLGTYNLEMNWLHLHQFKALGAVGWKNALTDIHINAYQQGHTNLQEADGPIQHYPLLQCNREAVNGHGRDENSDRPVDSGIIFRAKNILSFASNDLDLGRKLMQVRVMFEEDGGSASERFRDLKAGLRQGSTLSQKLQSIWDVQLTNLGNRTQRLGADYATVDANGSEFLDLVEAVFDDDSVDSHFFFVREFQKDENSIVLDPARLPDEYSDEFIVDGLAKEGINAKLRDKEFKRNTTQQIGRRVNLNLTIREARGDEAYKIDGFVRCYFVDHGDDENRGLMRADVRTGDKKQTFDQEHTAFLEQPRGTHAWIRDLSDKTMKRDGKPIVELTPEDLRPHGCEEEPIYHELIRENMKTMYKPNTTINFKTYRKGKIDTVPARVNHYVRCRFEDS